jgi:hypothetical protein
VDATNRLRTWAQVMRNWPGSLGVTKTELKAALDAADDWVDASQASYNSALPQPFRGSATSPQKAFLLAYVIMRRQGLLRAEED